MNFRFQQRIGHGLIALGVLAVLAVPAAATPLAGASRANTAPAAADIRPDTLNINHRRYRCYSGWCGNRYWRDDDWRYRNYHRYHRRNYYVQPRLYYGAPAYRYVQPRRYYRTGSAHVAWCYDRYRSYRAWDNTYQPYHGPRRQCWSPYR